MGYCIVGGCKKEVSKAGYKFCLEHYRANEDGKLSNCTNCGKLKDRDTPLCSDCVNAKKKPSIDQALNSTKIGERLGLRPEKVNSIFSELGWITRHPVKGWTLLPQGSKQGAIPREHSP